MQIFSVDLDTSLLQIVFNSIIIKIATTNNGTLLIKKNSIKAIIASTKKETEKILKYSKFNAFSISLVSVSVTELLIYFLFLKIFINIINHLSIKK